MQQGASQRKENPLDMGDLQPPASPCNALIITRNEQARGSSRLVALFFIAICRENSGIQRALDAKVVSNVPQPAEEVLLVE